ncbi:hypothetical protein BBD32_05180 [Elizabethkingia anophelis]|uniref:Uncharacterized protein n=2 Tax=Elizabethkingia anophelis TaxID=1117645 RepID=A0AAU8UZJ7_9FLAO|nr:hypothetical protein BBD32_05180 [Elizabethkingia anophelis]OPB65687.1 hypothetical protein BAY11_15465 [Elizabethkingia anophelis]
MTKNLLKTSLWGILTLSTLYSCRTEDGAMAQKQIEDKRFAVFVPKSGETINYANGFASLMKKYDQVHLTNISGINDKPSIKSLSASTNKSTSVFQDIGKYVEFNIRSQTVNEENGNKWVVFPKVENDKVTGLIVATLRDKETQVVFTDLDSNDGFYAENLPLFQQALDRYLSKKKSKLNAVASIKNGAIASVDPGADPGTDPPAYETDIEGVTVKGKPKPSDNGTNGLPSGPSTPIACEQIQGCYNPAETGGGASFPSTPIDKWVSQHIDASKLQENKCANEVYQKLKDNSTFFNDLLDKFEGKSILNLKFDIKDIGTIVANVGVENVKDGYVTVTLNPNYLGSTELGRANVFIHEMLHAYMAWQLLNSGWNGEDNAQSYKSIDERNLPSLLKAFREKEYKSGASEHEFMTNYYIPKIVNALKAYDPNLGTDSEYEAIAWNGLQGTDSYSNLKKTNPDREATINSLIRDNIKKVPCGN